MKRVNREFWRNSASLILLNKRNSDIVSCSSGTVNYDVLLQTRTGSASFPNSVVFPGGVAEPADESSDWFNLIKSFGYSQNDLNALHRPNTLVTPIFQPDPVKRQVSLRITAIRETFEELGFFIGSKEKKANRSRLGTSIISDIDINYWQKRISDNPQELLTLCKEHSCYPDIWNLHYWSNWMTPVYRVPRFDTAFFVTVLGKDTPTLTNSSEVTDVQWANPETILEKNIKKELELYPPQIYELNRLLKYKDIDVLNKYAEERSCNGTDLMYPVVIKAKDGALNVLPGDDLYPTDINYKEDKEIYIDKTILELRETSDRVHRVELYSGGLESLFVFQNYSSTNHINMGDNIIPMRTQLFNRE